METEDKIKAQALEDSKVHPMRALISKLRNLLTKEQENELIRLAAPGHVDGNLRNITDIGKLVDALERNGLDVMEILGAIAKIEFGKENMCLTGRTFQNFVEECNHEIQKAKLKRELSLSPKDSDFVGRVEEMNKMLCFIRTRSQTVTGIKIFGEAGMGKTALAEEVCHRSKLETIFINLRGKNSMRDFVMSVFYCLCHSKMMKLSYPEKTKEEVKFTENFLQSVDTLTDLVEDTLSLYETGTVLLLDNVDDIEEQMGQEFVSALQTFLNIKTDKVKFVMTSRRGFHADLHPEALLQVELKALPLDDAKQLIKNKNKGPNFKRLSDQENASLAEQCQCCPLVIKAVMSQRDKKSCSSEDHRPCLETVFFSLLEGSQKRLMELSVFEAVFNVEMAESVTGVDPRLGLSKLTEENLLQRHVMPCSEGEKNIQTATNVTYSFHPLVLNCLTKVCAKYPDRNFTGFKDKARSHFLKFFSDKIGSLKLDSNYHYRCSDYAYLIDFKHDFDRFFQVFLEKGCQFPNSKGKKSDALETLCKVLRFSSGMEKQKNFLEELDLFLENKDTQADALDEFTIKVKRVILLRQLKDKNEAAKILMKLDNKFSLIQQLPIKGFPLKNFVCGRYFYAKGLITKDEAEQLLCPDEQKERYKSALKCLNNSLKLFGEVKSKRRLKSLEDSIEVEIARVHNTRGSVHFSMQDYEHSFLEFENAYNCLCQYVKKNHMCEDGHVDVPTYLFQMGSAEWKKAAEFRRKQENKKAQSSLENALKHMQKAWNIAVKLGIQYNKETVSWLLRITDVHRQLARYTDAMENYRKASDQSEIALGILNKKSRLRQLLVVDTLHTLGLTQYAKGRHLQRSSKSLQTQTDDARKAFEESAQYYKSLISEIVNGNLHCKINRRIKRVHLKVLEILKDKDFEKTQQFYQDSVEVCDDHETGPEGRQSDNDSLSSSDEQEPFEAGTGPKKQDSGFEDADVAPSPTATRRSALVKQDGFDERAEGSLAHSKKTLSTSQPLRPPLGNLQTGADASSMPEKRARFQKQSSLNIENEELSVKEDHGHQLKEGDWVNNGDVELMTFEEAVCKKRLCSAQHDSALGDSISESFD